MASRRARRLRREPRRLQPGWNDPRHRPRLPALQRPSYGAPPRVAAQPRPARHGHLRRPLTPTPAPIPSPPATQPAGSRASWPLDASLTRLPRPCALDSGGAGERATGAGRGSSRASLTPVASPLPTPPARHDVTPGHPLELGRQVGTERGRAGHPSLDLGSSRLRGQGSTSQIGMTGGGSNQGRGAVGAGRIPSRLLQTPILFLQPRDILTVPVMRECAGSDLPPLPARIYEPFRALISFTGDTGVSRA